MKYYLYRWIREDINCPFYIGIGTKEHENSYRRAFRINNRSQWFKNVINKSKCFCEVLLESNDYTFIKEKEIEFIKLYGRKNKNLGELVNMTDGGDGGSNAVRAKRGKHKSAKKVYQFDMDGNFIKKYDCILDASEKTGIHKSTISEITNNKRTSKGPYIWSSTRKLKNHKDKVFRKEVHLYDGINKKFIKSFKTRKDLIQELNADSGHVCVAIKRNIRCKGFYLSLNKNKYYE